MQQKPLGNVFILEGVGGNIVPLMDRVRVCLVKIQLRCLEGSVQGDHLPKTRGDRSDLLVMTRCSPKIRILSVCKG